MKNKIFFHSFLIVMLSVSLSLVSCKKDPDPTDEDAVMQTEILKDFSSNLAQPIYNDLAARAEQMRLLILDFDANGTQANLDLCRDKWRDARLVWETSEAFLFGPASTESIDPRIDTWPVSFSELDSVLSSAAAFTTGYIDSLSEGLKGFHPIEYLLFGLNGNKTPAEFTQREIDFMVALSANLRDLTQELSDFWNPSVIGNFHAGFINAGQSGSSYPDLKSALLEIAGGMAGICDEVANGKMNEPFALQDSSLEESPYSQNSLIDFTSNIEGVEKTYLGSYSNDKKGLEDFVRNYNLSLDATIKQRIVNAKNALAQITLPFGEAIYSQPFQVQNAIDAINSLKDILDTNLVTLIQQYGK